MTVAAVSRCLHIVECLAGAVGGLELGDVAERVAMPKSAAHRLLSTLVEHGWVVQDADTQNYILSLRIATLAFHDLDVRVVTDVVQDVLDKLAISTREYCRLAVAEGEGLTWVAKAQGATTGLRYDADMGQEVALHATATGKAWLAMLPEKEAERIVTAQEFFRHLRVGPRAARNLAELKRRLAETRARGFATAEEEAEPGIGAIAVVFRTGPEADARVAGTVSIAGPVTRIHPARYEELVEHLRAAASDLEGIWRVRTHQRIETYGSRPGVRHASRKQAAE